MQTEKSGRPQAMIAMSGGVDSSVAAYLMQQAGYDCMGVTMKLYENEDAGVPRGHTCCTLDDVEDARRVAYALGMPYYVFNYKDAFREQVMARFAAAYQHGPLPHNCIPSSPCKICSRPCVKAVATRHFNCIMPEARLQPKYSSKCEKARAAAGGTRCVWNGSSLPPVIFKILALTSSRFCFTQRV